LVINLEIKLGLFLYEIPIVPTPEVSLIVSSDSPLVAGGVDNVTLTCSASVDRDVVDFGDLVSVDDSNITCSVVVTESLGILDASSAGFHSIYILIQSKLGNFNWLFYNVILPILM